MTALRRHLLAPAALAALLAFLDASPVEGYSVLAHEAVVDSAWERQIKPLLLRRFPRSSASELTDARGYAYGGCVVQDLGYYPFGSHFFTHLLHYVRSGDFVVALVRDAQTLNEYAFALGALAHYAADNTGHPEAINLAVPMLFPKIRHKYGNRVTFNQAPKEHVIVEFSLDVVHTAAGLYGPEAYTRFIGFQVSKPVLERAFRDTYGLPLADLFADLDLAIGTYRFAVSQMIPAITAAAWHDQRDRIARLIPDVREQSFVFRFPRPQYEAIYGGHYEKPGWFARLLAFVFRVLPKIGPLKPLSFETPTPEAERVFTDSLRAVTARFSTDLTALGRGRLTLANTDYDTGRRTKSGEYPLADETYAELVMRLGRHPEVELPATMRMDLQAFYGQAQPPTSRKAQKRWNKIRRNLTALSVE